MNKNILIVLGIVAVLVVAGFFVLGGDEPVEDTEEELTENGDEQQEEMATEDEADEIAVTYTDEGFSPQNVTVSSGTTVVFINESTSSMHVASDPHPSHTDLPEFDQLRGGDSYEFTFTEEGSWGYHNHILPQHTGTVVVE